MDEKLKLEEEKNSEVDPKEYELLTTIVNEGFSDIVMEAAKQNGARGGTVYKANGTGSKEYETFYGIKISPEKEIILIITTKDKKDQIMKAIYEVAGLETKGSGICFSTKLSDVAGIKLD